MLKSLSSIYFVAASLFFYVPCAEAEVVETPPAPQQYCTGDEYRQMDFWVGEWNLSWSQADGTPGTGKNKISQSDYGDCVISERFSMPGFTGMSVSTYHAPLKQWRQTWVDDQGGYYALVGGLTPNQPHHFELELTRLNEEAPYLRMIWEDVSPKSLTWRWQNRADETAEWADLWVVKYNR